MISKIHDQSLNFPPFVMLGQITLVQLYIYFSCPSGADMFQLGGLSRLYDVRHNVYSRILFLIKCVVKLSSSPEAGDLLYIYCRSPLNRILCISTNRMYWFRRHTCHIDGSVCNVQYAQTRAKLSYMNWCFFRSHELPWWELHGTHRNLLK